MSDHAYLYLDSPLVRTLAQAILNAICGQGTLPPVALDDQKPTEQYRLQMSATIAVMRHNHAVVTAATFHAAKTLGQARYGREWDDLSDPQRRECYREAADVITAYELHMARVLPQHIERQAVRIANQARLETEARRLANGTGSTAAFDRVAEQVRADQDAEDAERKRLDALIGLTEGRVIGFTPKGLH